MKQLKLMMVFCLLASVPLTTLAQDQADENKIKARVRSFFNANKNVLLGQAPDAALAAETDADDIREKGKPELDRHKQVADKLRSEGLEYAKGQILDIRYDQLTISGNTATLFATAVYKLHFKPKDGIPEFTQYDETREITLAKQGNKWVLTSQKLHIQGIPGSGAKDSLPTTGLPALQDAPAGTTGRAIRSLHEERDGYAVNETAVQETTGGPLATEYPWFVTYNRTAAANYAVTYAYTSNSASYRTYGNDCTNFISQCLKAGGWTDAGGLLSRTANTSWFYGSFESTTSYTWAGAHNHYFFHKESARSTAGTNVYVMSLGDVMHVDFSGDGHIDHTVIVSKEDAATGNDFVSYHTTNVLNKPVSQFISDCGATAKFYVWRVKSSY